MCDKGFTRWWQLLDWCKGCGYATPTDSRRAMPAALRRNAVPSKRKATTSAFRAGVGDGTQAEPRPVNTNAGVAPPSRPERQDQLCQGNHPGVPNPSRGRRLRSCRAKSATMGLLDKGNRGPLPEVTAVPSGPPCSVQGCGQARARPLWTGPPVHSLAAERRAQQAKGDHPGVPTEPGTAPRSRSRKSATARKVTEPEASSGAQATEPGASNGSGSK